ncbi:D-2-hydroxyacid dehydrogenase family protein [Neorhizobium alkalisoli]|uniref:Phosphoglycerate dehydrogenase-like enzyme n=1 Tax=Neorhizobium alkalisoli TaxID=528178 RepID=A0A561Q0U4_9HYPH|nr:D-2-hydroxyacid dehydrogenase family protein [Neorhizobium alkalisoli]TWF43991.1 phosphoglycerate dehydrogenase-like enzyme [Neorhizobium alkalisoli]
MKKIAVLDDYQNVALESADWVRLNGRAEITVFNDHVDDEERLIARLLPFDAICVMRERTPLPRRILERLPNLRFIATTGARNASIDLSAAHDLGITVSATGANGSGAPELTWALILAAARHIPTEVTSFDNGGWQTTVGRDLSGSTLGIIGLGRIGRQIAKVGHAFGMDVIAWSQNLTEDVAQAAGVRRVEKETLLRNADWVTLHLVLSERTKGLIGRRELAMMKSTAWLVNTSRGPLVDEAALIAALEAQALAGAALDVFDVEPLPSDHRFRSLPNVIATPHIGFVTEQSYRIFYRDTVANLIAWLDGRPVRVLSSPA